MNLLGQFHFNSQRKIFFGALRKKDQAELTYFFIREIEISKYSIAHKLQLPNS